MTFRPGESGNGNGRPRGLRSAVMATVDVEAVAKQLIRYATDKDSPVATRIDATRLLWEIIDGPRVKRKKPSGAELFGGR